MKKWKSGSNWIFIFKLHARVSLNKLYLPGDRLMVGSLISSQCFTENRNFFHFALTDLPERIWHRSSLLFPFNEIISYFSIAKLATKKERRMNFNSAHKRINKIKKLTEPNWNIVYCVYLNNNKKKTFVLNVNKLQNYVKSEEAPRVRTKGPHIQVPGKQKQKSTTSCIFRLTEPLTICERKHKLTIQRVLKERKKLISTTIRMNSFANEKPWMYNCAKHAHFEKAKKQMNAKHNFTKKKWNRNWNRKKTIEGTRTNINPVTEQMFFFFSFCFCHIQIRST